MTKDHLNIAGVILCGGKSSRMGQDKAQLIYHNKPLIEHAGDLLKRSGIQNIFYGGNKVYSGATHIHDIETNRGPLGGLSACMRSLLHQHTHIIVLPVDMPLLKPEYLRRLMRLDDAIEMAIFKDFFMPFRIKLSEVNRRKVDELLADKCTRNASVKNLVSCLETHSIKGNDVDTSLFVNVNNPKDWADLP